MLFGRFVPLIAALALGGSLAQKKIVPASAGTFRTDGATFAVVLIGVIVLTAGLDDPAGADARSDRRRADALMKHVLVALRRRRRAGRQSSSASATRP